MLNVAVIGMGVGQKHALAYKNHESCKLKSICDFDKNKIFELKKQFPDIDIFFSDNQIFEDKEIDIVSIASYDDYHFEQVLKAISNGQHIMVEKPLCLNEREMLKIYSTYSQCLNVKLSGNFVLRTNSRFIKIKEDIIKRKFGDLFYLEGDYYWGRKQKLFGWRMKMDFYSIILGAAIHMIDLVMWLMDSKPLSVQAMGNNIIDSNNEIKFDSFVVLLLKFENGVIAKVTGNGGCKHPHFHGLKVFGTKATAIQSLYGAYYLDSSEPNSKSIQINEPYPEKETRGKIIHSFVDSILDKTITPIVKSQEVFNTMSVCFAAEKAIKTKKEIVINYLSSDNEK